jgi:hypothetical protein
MNKKNAVVWAVALVALVLVALPVQAQKSPIQLSLFSPVQIVPEGKAISVVRLSLLYGKNTSVTGLDWGLVNHCTSGTSKGFQTGLVGMVDAHYTGFQANWVNITKQNFEGFQWGVINYAGHGNGFQLGLVNYAVSMKGLQIGLVNIIKQGGQFPVFPIINWSF